MANFMNSPKSGNIRDLRKKAPREAHNLAIELQRTIDDAVVIKNEVRNRVGFAARKSEKTATALLDAQGTKGKGRIGAGRGFQNRLDVATERKKWRSK